MRVSRNILVVLFDEEQIHTLARTLFDDKTTLATLPGFLLVQTCTTTTTTNITSLITDESMK
jgi:hypothetical protein